MAIKDVSSHDAARASLTSEETLHRLIESVEDYAIFALTPEGVVASWNLGAERIKGYKADEIIGQHFSRFYREEDIRRGWPAQELREATETGRFEDEGWRVRQDGSLFWANVVITAIRKEDGSLLGFTKITRDLSERRRREQQLRESEEKLRLLVDGAKDHAIFMLDRGGRVVGWNVGAERVHGFRADEIVGRDLALLYTEEDRAAGIPQRDFATASDRGFAENIGWRLRPDGSRFWADIDPDGRPRQGARDQRFRADHPRPDASGFGCKSWKPKAGALTSSSRCWRTSCAIRWRRSETPSACWKSSARRPRCVGVRN